MFGSSQPPVARVELDEDWMREWVAYGLSELDSYLGKWARFSLLYPEDRDA